MTSSHSARFEVRYVVSTLAGGWTVVDTKPRIRMVIARCGVKEHATMIAAALNAVGTGDSDAS